MSHKLKSKLISELLDHNHSVDDIQEILNWNNSCFNNVYSSTSWWVNEIIELTEQQAIDNIILSLKEDFWIESEYELNYLNPQKFIEKYQDNISISQSFEAITGISLQLKTSQKDSYQNKQINKALKKVKLKLSLPEKDDNYFKHNLLTHLQALKIECRHTYEMKWSRFIDKHYKWNFKQRISCKKIFWKPRLKDVPFDVIFQTLDLKYLDVNIYKKKAKDELMYYFGTFQEYSNDTSTTHEENVRDVNKDSVYIKYFLHHVLQNTTWNLTKSDFEKLFIWSWYKKYTNKEIQESDSNMYLKNIFHQIWITDIFNWIKFPVWKFKSIIKNNDFCKYHVKNITNTPIHLFVFKDYLQLLESIYSEQLDLNYIKSISQDRLNSLWFNNNELIKKHFCSERRRRKFFYLPWNEVFGYIFQRIIHKNPKLARVNKSWDMSQITHDDVEAFIEFLER